ncbi:MAG: putative collagen-binding domain-containing protein, partial [Gammaproteobacteria bacterium]
THVADWQPGDPNFQSADSGYEGKAIIGALNYLASENVNSFYFLPMNLGGDAKDTYPFVGRSGSSFDNTHYDISKLAQWNVVLDHAQRVGVAVQFVLNETESANENWLDNGTLGVERKLFYRELGARFGYLLAKKWNLCEENDYDISVLNSFADYLAAMDTSDAPITVHTKGNNFSDYNQIVGDERYSATSIQYDPNRAGEYVETWRENSASAGRPWVLDMDENQPPQVGLNAGNAVDLRKRVLYDVYFSGGNIEWYFGSNGQNEGGDQNTEDLRTREEMYEYMWYARRLLQDELPFTTMLPADSLVANEDGDYGGAEVFAAAGADYAVYLPNASGSPTIDLSDVAGNVTRRWYNPDNGQFEGAQDTLAGGDVITIGSPPSRASEDWVVLFQVAGGPVDSDGDGVDNVSDNCVNLANADQRDTDNDGFGNRCDADFNNDLFVNAEDLGTMRANFFATGDLDTDLNGDGVVNGVDLGILRTLFLLPPG